MNDAGRDSPDEVLSGEVLPVWDLSDLYPGRESPELERDLSAALEEADGFADAFRGRVSRLDAASLAAAIENYQRQQERLGRASSFAYLTYASAVSDPACGRFLQTVQERVNTISTKLLFFSIELQRMEDDAMAALCADPALSSWRSWIEDLRVGRPFLLSDEAEEILHEKAVVGSSAWHRLFDETMAELRFPFRGQNLSESEILDFLSDVNGTVRREAAQSLGQVLGDNIRPLALITNTLAKDKEIEDRRRGLARPISARNLDNLVEDEVVDALLAAVRNASPRISHRYYALKARLFGVDYLDYWDRNAPLPDTDDRRIPWEEAWQTVLETWHGFSPEMATLGQRFFDHSWIDAEPRPGKMSGAFSHPTVPSCHPYILLNYQGRPRDVMTVAHELGHGIHQLLAARQGYLRADTPLTLAETASVFGEMLAFRGMLERTEDANARRTLLAGKIEDMINTVVRQAAFCLFETELHERRRDGELTAEEIGDIWMRVQGESLGPAIRLGNEYRHYWSYIPHFVHTPFYVYAYAFGDCLVNVLYAVSQEAGPSFVDAYLDMLRAGGTLRHQELLAPFGLDASAPGFWARGLGVIEQFIDEFEALL